MKTIDLQRALNAHGASPRLDEDGDFGDKTWAALKAFQKAKGLGEVVTATPEAEAALTKAPPAKASPASSKFDAGSAKRLADAHPLIQKVMNAAREQKEFRILDSQRGRAAQEEAFRKGNSKAHFGQSAHNWSPSVAVDIAPVPLDWNDRASFIALSKIILPLAKEMGVPLRFGGDWNMNGVLTDEKLSDLPHYELHPWREFAKGSKLFGE